MDERKNRIGEHAATSALPWAVSALGPVPAAGPDRLEWQRRASSIGAYRELSGYSHPTDPIGPEPVTGTPDLRAAWHEAPAALETVDAPDVRGMPDGTLLHLRDTYPIETAWAPPWTGDQLRQARTGAWDARLAAIRATAEATAATRQDRRDDAARQRDLAASYHALHDAYQQRKSVLAAAMADRATWEEATRQQRQLAIAADAELRRRHPDQRHPPLRSAEAPAQHARPPRRARTEPTRRHRAAPRVRRPILRTDPPDASLRRPGLRRRRPRVPGVDSRGKRTRSCSRPSPRSSHQHGYWNVSRAATSTWRPPTDRRRRQ
jgi:hypothetical protein